MVDGRRESALAPNGMVATPHELATAAGLAALRDGGNALDAVIAANAVLTVVYPDQTSIGGDCFLIYYEAGSGRLHGLNGSGRAPAAADRDALRAAGHVRMPRRGIHTVTVPGTVDAWATAVARFGRLGLDRLLAPAIGYARRGFPTSPALSRRLAVSRALLQEHDGLRAVYLRSGAIPRAGERIRLPELADTLELIARDGAEPFYRGSIGAAIVATAGALGGCLTQDDLASHQGEWVEPLRSTYRGLTVTELPPNSQGLTALTRIIHAFLRSFAQTSLFPRPIVTIACAMLLGKWPGQRRRSQAHMWSLSSNVSTEYVRCTIGNVGSIHRKQMNNPG